MDRREFIISSCIACGAAALGISLLDSCSKTPATQSVNFTLDLNSAANSALNTKGGSVIQSNVIVICTGSSTFVALSSVCTHNGCAVGFNSSSNTLVCPCHGGTFSLSGSVLSGPPPSSLATYKTSLNGKILTVTS